MKISKLLKKIVMLAAAVCLAAAMTVTSFADGTRYTPSSDSTFNPSAGQEYRDSDKKEYTRGDKRDLINEQRNGQKYTQSEEKTTIHFMLASDTMAWGTMKDVQTPKNSSYQLPVCEYKAKSGYSFQYYVGIGKDKHAPGDTISIGDADEYWIWACFKPGDGMTTVHFLYPMNMNRSSTMEDVRVEHGGTLKLPECTLNAPVGYEFKYWSTKQGEVKPGYSITVGYEDELNVRAVFKEVKYVYLTVDNSLAGSFHDSKTLMLPFEKEYDSKGNMKAYVTLPKYDTIFTRPEGLIFRQWSVGKAKAKYQVKSGNQNPVVYAQWGHDVISLKDCKVVIDYNGDWNYINSQKEYIDNPKYYVYYTKNGLVLQTGVDYMSKISNNNKIGKNVGKIKLTGINTVKGTKTASFTIRPPKQKLVTKMITSGSQKGTLKLAYSPIDYKFLDTVELQFCQSEDFNYNKTIRIYVNEKSVKKNRYTFKDYLYLFTTDFDFDVIDKLLYVRARYVVNGVEGDWSEVKQAYFASEYYK
ncbi:MAG: hypothetical protein II820_08435 [Ruminiclostridium sp.]|nr:hypothetical protein [Ruminiclostridium sp.]